MITGYSGIPLFEKLGINEGMKVQIISTPEEYFQYLQKDISSQICKKNESPDLIHLFARTKQEFEAAMKKIKINMKAITIICVSWHKKSAGIQTDITEDIIRNYALQNDLVDVKVCAVSDVWSGLN